MRDHASQPDPPPEPDRPAGMERRDPTRRGAAETEWMSPDPPPIPERILKKVEPRSPKLPPMPSVPVKVKVDHRWIRICVIAAGAVMLGLVVALLIRPSPFDEAARVRWVSLCEDYGRWYGPLSRSVDEADETVMRELGLGTAIDLLNDAERFDPRTIIDRPEGNLAALGLEPPAAARTREAVEATARASAALARVERVFADWPTSASLESHHVLLIDHGWLRVADLVEQALKHAPPYGRGPVGPSLLVLQNLEAHTAVIARAVDSLDADLAVLASFNDPVFDTLIQAVNDLDASAPAATALWHSRDDPATVQLVGLAEALGPLQAFAQRFRDLVESDAWDTVDQARFRETGRAYMMLADGEATGDPVFRAWLDEIDDYRDAGEDDWRPAWASAQREALAPADQTIEQLRTANHYEAADALADRLAKTRGQIDRLLEAHFTAGNSRELTLQRSGLERDVREIAASAERLGQGLSLKQATASLREPTPLAEGQPWSSPAAEAFWEAERQRLADRLERSADTQRAAAELEAARQSLLGLIDPEAARGLPTLSVQAKPNHHSTTQNLLDAIRESAKTLREDTLREALAEGLEAATTVWPNTRKRYVDQLENFRAVAETAVNLDAALAGAYPLNNEAFSSNAGGLTAEIDAWPRAHWWNDSVLHDPADLVRARAARASRFDANAPWLDTAAAAMRAKAPAEAFAAWRALSIAEWPRDPGALDIVSTLEKQLLSHAEEIGKRDPERGEELRAEIAAARPRHWALAMSRAEKADDVRALASRAEAMGVVADRLPEDLRHDLRLGQAQSAILSLKSKPGPEREAQVLSIARRLADQLVTTGQDAPQTDFNAALQSITAQHATHQQVLSEAGPARRGWTVAADDNGRSVTFTRDGWALTFVRIDPESGPPFFVCTTELPVGLAFDAVAWAKKQDEFAALMPSRGNEDTRKGPKIWVHTNNGLALNPRDWLGDTPHYAPGLTPSPPTAKHPINYVTAEAASYLAALLGCRLPTTDQWAAAVQAYPVPPRVTPNLRDTTWLRHANHTADLIRDGVPRVDWANSDAFRPTSPSPAPGKNNPNNAAADNAAGNFHPINDGTLWFLPASRHADGSAAPEHLVGNVAELTVSRPVDPDGLLDNGLPIATRRDAFRRAHKSDFAVLGGSALSSASINPKAAQPFNVFSGSRGYADVGVRLVFEVPFVSPGRQAEMLILSQPFLR
ncbi:MAG: hypothetical protein AAGH99_11915 [Planctomycetota bacterium]